MATLITSDTHFTNNERDEYRWDLFPWLLEQAKKHKVSTIMLLGDTTDAKDKHPARLTNRIVDNLKELSKVVPHLYILRGNHDYIDEKTPYFRFLNHIDNIQFIVEPTIETINGALSLLVPNTKDFTSLEIPKNIKYLFCHQTFKGAKGESGIEMDGIDPTMFCNWEGQVISGDIHTPQKMYGDKITYVGSPYHVHFGDRYLPRVVLLDKEGKVNSLYFKTVRRFTIQISNPKELTNITLTKGDQVKIRLVLDDIVNWEAYRKEVAEYCKSNEIFLHQTECIKQNTSLILSEQKEKLQSLSSQEIFRRYCERSKIGPETIQYGEKIVREKLSG